jgi:hypothetical protein
MRKYENIPIAMPRIAIRMIIKGISFPLRKINEKMR